MKIDGILLQVIIAAAFILGFVAGMCIQAISTVELKDAAVELGYAQRDEKTGEWEWIKEGE